MKTTHMLSNKVKSIDSLKRFSSYKGRKVFSKSGEPLGKIIDVVFQNDSIAGYIVKGKQMLFLDKEYFSPISEDAIMLTIDPVTSIMGKQVYDAEARKIGKVISIERKSNANDFTELVVKKNFYSKQVSVPKKDIEVSKKNVILKKVYE